MGAGASLEDGNHNADGGGGAGDVLDPFDGIDTLGYRVLGVQPKSPAAKAGLVSFLDFLVGANDRLLLGSGEGLDEGDEYDDVDLPALLEDNKGQPVEFLVYNIKSQQARLVSLTPEDSWGGAGLLGVTIRLDNYAGAEDRLIRVLSVEAQSPAAIAGLVPLKDFLLGTTHQTLESVSTLARLLHQNADRVMEVYVYNCDSDVVRVVALMPTLSWGGAGLLGAEVGVGYLHRLPHTVRHTEGASVQRKVRYVTNNTNTNNNNSSTAASNNTTLPIMTSNKSAPTPADGTKKQQQQQLLLELEPQLEMEPPEEEDDEQSHDDMSSVALDTSSHFATGAGRHQQQQQKQQQQSSSNNGIVTAASNYCNNNEIEQSRSKQRQPQQQQSTTSATNQNEHTTSSTPEKQKQSILVETVGGEDRE